ncbi:peptidylprolyl isomerase [Psychromonas hadalis]|uniref:peptidylprolyl isomerase n=1 Tax=Psychromonas hadalis TaxID=211669 RepID=UPI0003B44BBD
MKTFLSLFMLIASFNLFAAENPTVVMETSKGQIIIELFPDEAPKTVANFLAYVQKDGYKKTTFHRVINGFMIQGGGFSAKTGNKVSTLPPVENESRNGLSNERGTLAMARTANPHSASRQFFINHKDNAFLDAKGGNWGYTVFGEVTLGMDVVDKIAKVKTASQDKPVQPVIINSIKLLDREMK